MADELSHVPVQAVLLADNFSRKFLPITLERPQVLWPLVNRPMIDYTLTWLESAGVEQVFVFCCAHSDQIIAFLDESDWLSKPNFSVTTIESENSFSAGDALRSIHMRNVIHGDFVLISGDTMSNMSLTEALQEHKDRRNRDRSVVMTMVIHQSMHSLPTPNCLINTDELFMAIDPNTKQLLYYEPAPKDMKGYLKATKCLEKNLLGDNISITRHQDKKDCHIDICSPEVLSLFTDNFDYQYLRRDFVKGLLVDDIMGYKIFTHEIKSGYAARVDNYRSYATISESIIQPENSAWKLNRPEIYRAEIRKSHSAQIDRCSVIGKDTKIGDNTKVLNSVVGDGCVIGSDVLIEHCYIWNNVTIEDDCELKYALLCDGVTLKSGAILYPGVVLSFNVVIEEQFIIGSYSKLSLLQPPTMQANADGQDNEEELEYADGQNSGEELEYADDQDSGTSDSSADESSRDFASLLPNSPAHAAWVISHQIGGGGSGYEWPNFDGSYLEQCRHSLPPMPAHELPQIAGDDYGDYGNDYSTSDSGDGEDRRDYGSDYSASDSGDDKDCRDAFEKEVEAAFLRAVGENVEEQSVIQEVNSLRSASNLFAIDCVVTVFYSVIKYALDTTPHNSASELYRNAATLITTWQNILKYYTRRECIGIFVIFKLEEICKGIGQELSPFFSQILQLLYECDILREEDVFDWASRREATSDAARVFVKQSEDFILRLAKD